MTTNSFVSYNKEIFVKDYFDIHNHYIKQYGKSTLILMQVGSFHEAYNTDDDGPDLFYLGERINMTVTQKNKSKPLTTSNPRMMGFPSYIVDEMVDRIVSLGYTIIRIDQTTEPPNPKREIVGIFSPSTNITNSGSYKDSNLVCIIFDAIKLKTSNPLLIIGMSSYDMTTGTGMVYETISTNDDTMIALDNTIRFLEKYPPAETIYHFSKELTSYLDSNSTINRMSMDDILKYIGINNSKGNIMTTYKLTNPELVINVRYQNTLLEEIFKNNQNLSSINLHAYNYARLSLVGLLEFVKNHQPILLNKLTEPNYFDNQETLYLGNRCLDQLDIMNNNSTTGKTLFDIICKTKTPMGKRFLIDQLCNPLINPDELNKRYEIIDIILKNKLYDNISKELNNIHDIPKIIRKMELNKVNPNEIFHLYQSIEQIKKVYKIMRSLDDNSRKIIKKSLDIDKQKLELLKELTHHIDVTFDINYIETLNYNNYKEETKNYILNDSYPNIVELTKKIETSNNFMDLLVLTLEKYIEEQNSKVIKKDSNSITLKFNDRDGHYMLITKRRCKILRDKLDTMKELDVNGIKIQIKDLEFSDLPKSNNTKITCRDILKISTDVVNLKSKLAAEIKEAFYKETNIIINRYHDCLVNCSNTIKFLDFLNSGALTAFMCGYCKPNINIKINGDSYFEAEQLRHPIIETINTDTPYHPHNISLGNNNNNNNYGILLYGINSSGKSTLMKSIGIAVILAQIGYYVPAKSYTYSPYKNIFTRIIGNDNIYRGMSSFMVEMIELMAILKRNNNNTLVIADELAKGTEEKSANIIVTYMLETLEKNKTNFITATHLHSIADLPSVKKIKGINTMHIKVSYDDKNDKLIYDRELSMGQGDKYYGVMVAKYMMHCNEFNTRTKELEQEYEDYHVKKSNYNNELLVLKCEICGAKKKLESHHIEPQRSCDKFKSIENPHIKRNAEYNLVILCSKCHDSHDRGEINIIGWQETSNGRQLQIEVK